MNGNVATKPRKKEMVRMNIEQMIWDNLVYIVIGLGGTGILIFLRSKTPHSRKSKSDITSYIIKIKQSQAKINQQSKI